MLSHWLLPRLNADHPQLVVPATPSSLECLDLIDQQDGASAYRAYPTMTWICECYTDVVSYALVLQSNADDARAVLAQW